MQTALGVAAFFLFLFGSMVLAALTGALVAKVTRSVLLWVPLSLAANLLVQIAYFSALNLLRSLWKLEAGEAPFWERYCQALSRDWLEVVKFGLLLGVVAWVWSLKRVWHFFETDQPGE